MLNIMFPFNHYNNPLRLIYVIHKKIIGGCLMQINWEYSPINITKLSNIEKS